MVVASPDPRSAPRRPPPGVAAPGPLFAGVRPDRPEPTLLQHRGSALRTQAEEDAAIWSRLWIGVGFSQDIPSTGDVLPYTAGHHGIHVERSPDGGLVGRFNKAQHGGCRTVPVQCRTGAKTRCSFTACGHSRDRRPILAEDPERAVHLDQYLGLRPERLLPVAVATYGPLIVARLDPRDEAAPLWPTTREVFGRGDAQASTDTCWSEVAAAWTDLAVGLAEGGATLFPNIVVRRDAACTTVVVLQPVALERTLCRVRSFWRDGDGSGAAAASSAVGALHEAAKRVEAGARLPGAAGGPERVRFDAELRRAIGRLGDEPPARGFAMTEEGR